MTDLIERYVHQVGRYLPSKERAEIQAELRSQIQDQLEDRYAGKPTEADVAAVLTELGDPRRMAASYGGEQYLIGPELYPIMMMVLRRGWVLVPPIAVFVHVLAALLGDESGSVVGLLVDAALGAAQATFIFTGIVVIIFAILQHSGEDLSEITGKDQEFDPLALPEVDEPAGVDRVEAAFGAAFGAFAVLLLIHFLRVGGLTLRLNPTDPGDVIPAPVTWLIVLLVVVGMQVILQLAALVRNRWTVPMWLVNIALDVVGAVALYYVLWLPLFDRLVTAVPALVNVPFLERTPEIIFGVSIVITLIEGISKLVKMLGHHRSAPSSYNVKTKS
jgi:hypothetical protein